jgi:hypothetical protein
VEGRPGFSANPQAASNNLTCAGLRELGRLAARRIVNCTYSPGSERVQRQLLKGFLTPPLLPALLEQPPITRAAYDSTVNADYGQRNET